MNGNTSYEASPGSRLVWVCVAVLMLGMTHTRLVATASAQELRAGATTAAASGSSDGIQVHGHWVIEIREPDGRLVSRNEFENELDPDGQSILADLLTHKVVAGPWAVVLSDSSGTSSFDLCEKDLIGKFPSPIQTCRGAGLSGGELAVVAANGTIVLTGAAVAPSAFNLILVNTALASCEPGTAPCTSGVSGFKQFVIFSGRFVPAQSVAQGQIVQASVTISFSSPPPPKVP